MKVVTITKILFSDAIDGIEAFPFHQSYCSLEAARIACDEAAKRDHGAKNKLTWREPHLPRQESNWVEVETYRLQFLLTETDLMQGLVR